MNEEKELFDWKYILIPKKTHKDFVTKCIVHKINNYRPILNMHNFTTVLVRILKIDPTITQAEQGEVMPWR